MAINWTARRRRWLPAQELQAFYPKDNYIIQEVTDEDTANSLFYSRTSACWANGPITDTQWCLLAKFSPRRAGEKMLVQVCLTSLIKEGDAARKYTV